MVFQFLHCEVRGSPEQIASVVHRDLSSTSVMVNADGACCITDFGMALRWLNTSFKLFETFWIFQKLVQSFDAVKRPT